uniref:Seven TM Receptor n=1 Tax=Caenorhabditis tropicalis TaxID=1561998 RepID=A0A1I7TC89_9PELO
MRIEAFESLKTLIQLISCAFAITLNSLLIFLIIKKSPKKMGTYRNLMCYFCGISLVFTLLDVIVKPTLIPVLFMFIPFGILFTCPLLLINCEFLSAPITIIYAVYPALDPLPCLFFVDNYRNWISGVFSRRNKSKVSVVMDDQVTKNIYSI